MLEPGWVRLDNFLHLQVPDLVLHIVCHFWFMDRVNVMELVAYTCIAWTSVLCLIAPEHTELAQQFKAFGSLVSRHFPSQWPCCE